MSKEFQIRDGNLIASFDLENEDGDIDFCKLLKISHGVADEIGMFVDYVAMNKIIKDQSKQITDLETKLAESERKLEEYEKCNCKECMTDYEKNLNQIIDKFLNENIKLKQQLAEKEKEISNLKGLVNERDKQIKNLKTNKKRVVEHKNKVKIDYAIEQLEKVKSVINTSVRDDHIIWDFDIKAHIDNQIKQLKEGK